MFELSSLTAGGVYLPVFAFIAGLVAFVAFVPLSRFVPQPVSGSRFLAIDGLRGYLALAVLVHHSSIWYVYARTGKWSAPPSALYAQLGAHLGACPDKPPALLPAEPPPQCANRLCEGPLRHDAIQARELRPLQSGDAEPCPKPHQASEYWAKMAHVQHSSLGSPCGT